MKNPGCANNRGSLLKPPGTHPIKSAAPQHACGDDAQAKTACGDDADSLSKSGLCSKNYVFWCTPTCIHVKEKVNKKHRNKTYTEKLARPLI